MKALVRERVKDWCVKFQKLKKNVVEITGDVTPKSDLITSANIIITTPEKWDGMSRNWHQKDFVKSVGLMIIDEIHLLAEERGPVLEVIVSRMNYINSFSNGAVRIIGLSTAMANAGDLANWLGVKVGILFLYCAHLVFSLIIFFDFSLDWCIIYLNHSNFIFFKNEEVYCKLSAALKN